MHVGVLGDTNLTGAVDFASPASGFIVIEDSSDASPLLWSVDVHGLSGLWAFPTGGFATIPTCYSETFVSANTWTVTHNLNTENVLVQVYNDATPPRQIEADRVALTNVNTVTVAFNVAQAGHVVVIACENS